MKVYERLEGFIDRAIEPFIDVKDWISEKVSEGITSGLINLSEEAEKEFAPLLSPLVDSSLKNPKIPPELRDMIGGIKKPKQFVQIAAVLPFLVGYIISMVMNIGAGSGEEVRQYSYKLSKPSILSPDELIRLEWKDAIKTDEASNDWEFNGYDTRHRELLTEVNRPLLDVNILIKAQWRELMDGSESSEAWKSLGYNDRHREILTAASRFYPSAMDFIRFAVRDTFQPEIVKKYGYDDNYPTGINIQAEKAGISPEWMKHYWRAHWELPSPNMAFEMLHRKQITIQEAEDLLRIADYAPAFIKPMLAVSYKPYTRVDVRRMFNAGVLGKDAVMASYQDLGYDEDKAEKLTEWTVSEGMSEERDLTKAEIKAAYKAGALSRADAESSIQMLGYDKDEADIILNLVDYQIETGFIKREKKVAVKRYVKNRITHAEFIEELDALKLSEREKKITEAEAALQIKEEEE